MRIKYSVKIKNVILNNLNSNLNLKHRLEKQACPPQLSLIVPFTCHEGQGKYIKYK